MNCENCGAPMVLFREHDYYFCEHCGSFYFPLASPDGVRLLGEAPEGTLCPNCHLTLHMATLDDHYRGYQCANCQGLLLNRNSFRMTIETRRARAVTPPDPPRPLNQAELGRDLNCPVCHQTMNTHPYLGPGTIVIDTCDPCNLIWLDYGELSRVVNAPGKDRGGGLNQLYERFDEEQKRKMKKDRAAKEKNLLQLLDKFF